MSDPTIQGPAAAGRPGGVRPTDAARTTAPAGGTDAKPEFRALLERLERRAEELRTAGAGANDAQGLGQAVAQAKESLDEVLGLKDQLLEAYARQQMTNDNPSPKQ